MTMKSRGHSGKQIARKSRNSCRLNGRSCGCIGTVDPGPKCAHSWDQIQTLKESLFCHTYSAYLCSPVFGTVIVSRAVSNRESRYSSSTTSTLGHSSFFKHEGTAKTRVFERTHSVKLSRVTNVSGRKPVDTLRDQARSVPTDAMQHVHRRGDAYGLHANISVLE